jgi:phosphoribosyl 1,2-cyclic phosphodiesterase
MTIRFAMLGSGSGGNATVIRSGATTLLVDCGFMLRETERRLRRLGIEPQEITGVLVTHEHADHVGGVARFSRKYRLPVWLTPGTYTGWDDPGARQINNIAPDTAFTLGDLQVQPYSVPHDAREPCHFVFSDGAVHVGVLSDAGSVTPRMREALDGCAALLVEFNHDVEMLANGPYPAALKRRVGGPLGHLSNVQAADLLRAVDCTRLQHVVLTHLSRKNNTSALAVRACAEALGCSEAWPQVADQDEGLVWREVA